LAEDVFFVGFLTAMNSPEDVLRFVQAVAPPRLVFNCVRFFAAPLRALSPTGLLVATVSSQKKNPPRIVGAEGKNRTAMQEKRVGSGM
jgi:hypothetical protein